METGRVGDGTTEVSATVPDCDLEFSSTQHFDLDPVVTINALDGFLNGRCSFKSLSMKCCHMKTNITTVAHLYRDVI